MLGKKWKSLGRIDSIKLNKKRLFYYRSSNVNKKNRSTGALLKHSHGKKQPSIKEIIHDPQIIQDEKKMFHERFNLHQLRCALKKLFHHASHEPVHPEENAIIIQKKSSQFSSTSAWWKRYHSSGLALVK